MDASTASTRACSSDGGASFGRVLMGARSLNDGWGRLFACKYSLILIVLIEIIVDSSTILDVEFMIKNDDENRKTNYSTWCQDQYCFLYVCLHSG